LGAVVDRPQHRLDPLGYRHPILQAFRGRGGAGLLTTPVLKHFHLEVPPDSQAKIVLALADGDPLVVEQSVHGGTVTLVATSADLSWTALPLWPSFVPLVQEIVAWGAAARQGRRNLTVGQPLEAWFPASAAGQEATIKSPNGSVRPAPLRTEGDYAVLDDAKTSQSGIYVASLGPSDQRRAMFAVNVDAAESDLTQVDPDELRNQVWQSIPFTIGAAPRDSVAHPAGESNRPIRRLQVDLLFAVMGLLLFETFLGWKLGVRG
jgi:hypothetical protein